MESLSIDQKAIVLETLTNIRKAISQLEEWNKDVKDADEWRLSSSGMQLLAADCMLLEAIGEGVKQLEKRAGLDWLNQQPQIAWREIMGMRNHIAHGYFEVDADLVFSVLMEDLSPLAEAVDFLKNTLA